MNKGKLNDWIGIALLISVISFFFYKSVFSELPINNTLSTIEDIERLQVQLHRDMLRYRSSYIRQYDILNGTLYKLHNHILDLSNNTIAKKEVGIDAINIINRRIMHQAGLVEDFKTHHSILQNSLSYIFNASTDLYSATAKNQAEKQRLITAELITLLLKYNENPEANIANRIYPLIDKLNLAPDTDTNSLINHSLMIIERIPEIDDILYQFNSLNIEKKIISLKNRVLYLKDQHNNNARTFNILLFLCTIYLVFYILYIFITLRISQEQLSNSNTQLNDEISHRSKTEKALYQLVNIDKNTNNAEDRILFLLNALCKALDVEYAYITKINSSATGAEIIGLLDHGMFSSNINYQTIDNPCEEVIKSGRLIFNRDFSNYFPNCTSSLLKTAVSYIGVSLTDKEDNVIGTIAIASDSPIEDTNLAENILRISTSRAIIELEHQVEINNTARYQQGLKLIDGWISRLITEGYNKDAFFKNICCAAQEITKTQLAAFPVFNKDQKTCHFLAASGLESEKLENVTANIEDASYCSQAILNNKNILFNDFSTAPLTETNLFKSFNINSVLITPVTIKNQPYGAIVVCKRHDDFDEIDEQLLTQFSQNVQMAIINMQLVSDIKSERERAEVTLHSIGDAVITTNINGKIEYMNHVAESLTAWSFDEVKNHAVQDVFRIEDLDTGDPIHDVINSCLYDGIAISKSILSLVSKNDNKKDIESSISPILNTSGNTEGVVIVFHDETQRRQLEKTIRHQATHDPLTNLLNRKAFDLELLDHVHDVINNEKQHVLCYMDLDKFKLINDTAGHNAGDQCLIYITSLIHSCIRSEDIFSRLGGDEFGLILKNCTKEGALKITNQIANTVSEMGFSWDGYKYKLGISIGINILDKESKDIADATRRADLACYTSKDLGHVYIYEEEDSELIRRQEETFWATRLTDAIANNRLQLYAQSIVLLNNNETLPYNHVEVLVRLLDEDDQLITPNAFIPAAEHFNLVHLIDRKVILETFKFIDKYSEWDENITHYSINLSGNTLGDNDIIEYIIEAAEEFNINAKLICFEITETSAIKNLQKAKNFIKELKSHGFMFALDDFGSGLSSFQYLKNLPVDYLKIDGSFVADMVNNNIDYAMVAAINEVAHIMGIKTIAEYVENDQIYKKLQEIKVDFGQGYGIEQPRPIKDILSLPAEDKKSPALKIVHNIP